MFNKFISLLAVIFYVRWTLPYLGKERFGVWMTMTSIITFISIFSDLGLGSSMVNSIAGVKAKGEDHKMLTITSSCFFFLSIMAVLMGSIFYFSRGSVLSSVTTGMQGAAVIKEIADSLLALVLIFLVSLPFVTVDKTLEGMQMTYISSIWSAIGNFLSIIATGIIASKSLGLVWLILGTIGIQSFFKIVYYLIEFNGRLKPYRPSVYSVSTVQVKKLLESGLIFFILNIFNVLAFQVDNIIISKQVGPQYVAQFAIMQKLVTISLFFWFYTISLWPAFADAHAKRDLAWIRKTVKFVFKLNILLGILFSLIVVFLSGKIVSFWSKDIIAAPSLTMTLSFASFIMLNGLLGLVSIVFNSGPLIKKHIIGFCLAAITSFCLKFTIVKNNNIDYLMFIPMLPFLLFYILPCYFIYKKYIND
jgi:O-antigen/teichoic acid export membrane protein